MWYKFKLKIIQHMSLPKGAAVKESYTTEISGLTAKIGMCKLPKLPLDAQFGKIRYNVFPWKLTFPAQCFLEE